MPRAQSLSLTPRARPLPWSSRLPASRKVRAEAFEVEEQLYGARGEKEVAGPVRDVAVVRFTLLTPTLTLPLTPTLTLLSEARTALSSRTSGHSSRGWMKKPTEPSACKKMQWAGTLSRVLTV